MKGGNAHKSGSFGYTIVEVMIFVAISGFMFVLAAIFVSGKQANAEYRQSLNDINTQIQGVMNEVANGEYPSLGNFTCTSPPPNTAPKFNASTTGQGANGGTGNKDGCTFMGKVVQFGVAGTNNTGYNTYTVAGRQYASTDPSCVPAASSNDTTPVNFCQAKPVAVDRTAPAVVNLTQSGTLQSGLTFTKMIQCSAPCSGPGTVVVSGVGFFGGFGSYSSAGSNDLESGAQSITTVTFSPNLPTNDETAMVNNINNNLTSVYPGSANIVNQGSVVVLCFSNGTKKGAVTIGGTNSQQLSTTVIYGASGLAQTC